MEALKCKMKISILWIFFAVATSGATICLFMEPGFLDDLREGIFRCQTHSILITSMFGEKLGEGVMVLFALSWLLPLTMSFLTQILSHAINRRANIILGVFLVIVAIDGVVSHIRSGWFPLQHLLFLIVLFIVPVLIIWYAWRLPKEEM